MSLVTPPSSNGWNIPLRCAEKKARNAVPWKRNESAWQRVRTSAKLSCLLPVNQNYIRSADSGRWAPRVKLVVWCMYGPMRYIYEAHHPYPYCMGGELHIAQALVGRRDQGFGAASLYTVPYSNVDLDPAFRFNADLSSFRFNADLSSFSLQCGSGSRFHKQCGSGSQFETLGKIPKAGRRKWNRGEVQPKRGLQAGRIELRENFRECRQVSFRRSAGINYPEVWYGSWATGEVQKMGGELQEDCKMVNELQEKCRKWEVCNRRGNTQWEVNYSTSAWSDSWYVSYMSLSFGSIIIKFSVTTPPFHPGFWWLKMHIFWIWKNTIFLNVTQKIAPYFFETSLTNFLASSPSVWMSTHFFLTEKFLILLFLTRTVIFIIYLFH